MPLPEFVNLVEVAPRDGLQNEAKTLSTQTKIELINRLSKTGLRCIEVSSFVSAKQIPQLSDAAEVFTGIEKSLTIRYPVLVPNTQGLEKALQAGAQEIAVLTTTSETFAQRNTHCSVAESFDRIKAILDQAQPLKLKVRAYLSCVLGCPYEGKMDPRKVAELSEKLYQLGCHEISLGDTIGIGTPNQVIALLDAVTAKVPVSALAAHFHNTYNQALVNLYVALQAGVSTIDCSVAGLGGCPYAKGASGNVATEDVLYLLNGLNIQTGVDLKKILAVSHFITQKLANPPRSGVALADPYA